jgi:hypothetical protein
MPIGTAEATAATLWEAHNAVANRANTFANSDPAPSGEPFVKKSRNRSLRQGLRHEAPVRVELTMADLQSAALASWLRRHFARMLMPARDLRQGPETDSRRSSNTVLEPGLSLTDRRIGRSS